NTPPKDDAPKLSVETFRPVLPRARYSIESKVDKEGREDASGFCSCDACVASVRKKATQGHLPWVHGIPQLQRATHPLLLVCRIARVKQHCGKLQRGFGAVD